VFVDGNNNATKVATVYLGTIDIIKWHQDNVPFFDELLRILINNFDLIEFAVMAIFSAALLRRL
jgi:hypothetical protein